MRATASLIRREFSAYFLSPIAYVVLAVFLFVTGLLFIFTLKQLTAHGPEGVEFPMQYMFGEFWLFWLMYLFIPPLLTMRLFAEERSTGTLEMLMTSPLRDWEVVFSKYAACLAFYVLMWLPTLLYLPLLLDVDTWGPLHWRISVRPVLSSYLGIFLAGSMFLALGMFVSSLVKSQMVAALISMLLCLPFIASGFLPDVDTGSFAYRVLFYFSVPLHFSRDFTRGVVDTRHLVLYVSVALFCFFLTVRSLESRRWR